MFRPGTICFIIAGITWTSDSKSFLHAPSQFDFKFLPKAVQNKSFHPLNIYLPHIFALQVRIASAVKLAAFSNRFASNKIKEKRYFSRPQTRPSYLHFRISVMHLVCEHANHLHSPQKAAGVLQLFSEITWCMDLVQKRFIYSFALDGWARLRGDEQEK